MVQEKTRVLIIDDEPETVSILTMFLNMVGFDASGELTGRAGQDAIKSMPPDVLILDLMLPDADGYEICRALRAEDATRNMPIIILSARTTREDVRKGYEVGATRYMKKPVDLDFLANEVKTLAKQAKHKEPPKSVQEDDAKGRPTGG